MFSLEEIVELIKYLYILSEKLVEFEEEIDEEIGNPDSTFKSSFKKFIDDLSECKLLMSGILIHIIAYLCDLSFYHSS